MLRKTPKYRAPEFEEYAVNKETRPVNVIAALRHMNAIQMRYISANHAHPKVQTERRRKGRHSKKITAVESTTVPRMILMKYAKA
jgi:hypothetical protein